MPSPATVTYFTLEKTHQFSIFWLWLVLFQVITQLRAILKICFFLGPIEIMAAAWISIPSRKALFFFVARTWGIARGKNPNSQLSISKRPPPFFNKGHHPGVLYCILYLPYTVSSTISVSPGDMPFPTPAQRWLISCSLRVDQESAVFIPHSTWTIPYSKGWWLHP